MRKIIQITNNKALCEDGSVWEYNPRTGFLDDDGWKTVAESWCKLPDIPQDEPQKEEVK